MLEVYRAGADLQQRFQSQGWRFYLIGGLALQRWGEPRETIDVDVTLLTGFGGEESAVARATPYEFAPEIPLLTASAEDLIVMKAFASRPKDWVDLEGILIRQHGRLDWAYVDSQLRPLADLKEEPEILERLASMRNAL